MPSKSKAQHNLMAMVAHDPKAAKRIGIPQSVGRDYVEADKGRKFGSGGPMKESKAMMKKEVSFMKKKGAPKSMLKHEMAEMRGKKFAEGGDVEDDTDAEGYGTKITRSPRTFAEAFKEARAKGKGTEFTWNGRKIAAYRKGEEPESWKKSKSVESKPAAEPVADSPMSSGPTGRKALGRDTKYDKFVGAMAPGSKEPERDTTYDKFVKTMASGYRGGGSINQKGGSMRGYARGGGIESRGKTKGTMVKMASGGAVFRKAADGIASKGKTKGKMVKMAYGGKC